MKTFKRIMACSLALTMLAGLTACDEGGAPSPNTPNAPNSTTASTTAASSTDPDENAATDKEAKDIDTSTYTPSGNAGLVKYLSYYDVSKDQKGTEQCLVFQSDVYGGTLEQITASSGTAYYEKLGTLIAADDSPDIALKDAYLNPETVSKNLFEPLDSYIDMNSPLWVDMKGVIESMGYKGKHYYYPHRITTSFALNYSKKTIEENNLPDPYELYKNGEWTWDAWRAMMTEFCDKDEENIGVYMTDTIATSLVHTTGVPLIQVNPDGTIINNMNTPEVTKAMNFYEELCRSGLTYSVHTLGDWVSPQVFAENCDKLLFLGMEPEWTYTAATEKLQNPTGVDSDIFNTVSEFAFVPFPKAEGTETYYQSYDTYGFVVPKGAKNIAGAVDMINCFRVYDTDENISAQVKKDHIAPEPIIFQSGKYEGKEKWQITWGEQEYDLWREMCDPANFTFLTEGAFGCNADMWTTYSEVIMAVVEQGESWAQRSSEIAPTIDAALNEYMK